MIELVAHTLGGLASAYLAHELGHVVAAIAVRARAVRWSPLRPYVDATLPAERTRAHALFFAGGPLANIAIAVGVGTLVAGGGIVALVHALAAVVTLLPTSSASDGARILRALRG